MAKVCTDIRISQTCDGISITDVSGLYPDRANGWLSTGINPAVPTWNASGGTFPSGSVVGGTYLVTVAGTVDSIPFEVNDTLVALVSSASTTVYAANWIKADYVIGTLAVPTSDIESITLTVTGLSDPTEYAVPNGYTDPALSSMLVAELTMDLPDGLYTFDYQMTFTDEDNCATGSTITMLLTKSISCCLRSLEAKALLSNESSAYENLIVEHAKLSMELHGLITSVNAELITDPVKVKEILDDLSTRCKNLSKNCDC